MLAKLLDRLRSNQNLDAIIWKNKTYTYGWLKNAVDQFSLYLVNSGVAPGSVIILKADYSPNAIALLIAMMKHNCIIAPLTSKHTVKQDEYCKISEAEYCFEINSSDDVSFKRISTESNHDLFMKLKKSQHPGLVIFSSGTTGFIKGAVHDFFSLLENFSVSKKCLRIISFLLFDHIGGINTLFYTLFNGGCLVIPEDRSPLEVCACIEKFKVQALTTTPTFLNLLLISEVYSQFNLDSLQVINYGSEVMSETVLDKIHQLFPGIRLSQAYGLSEVGVLPAKSKDSNSLFIKFEKNNVETRVVGGLLEIKSASSMLGYLNANNLLTDDGWFKTGDAVEVNGEYVRILGRQSEMINVGGEKVYPAEIEKVIEKFPGVEQVSVYSEVNSITGQIVVAKIKVNRLDDAKKIRICIREFCNELLPAYKIPQKIKLVDSDLYSERFKKIRK